MHTGLFGTRNVDTKRVIPEKESFWNRSSHYLNNVWHTQGCPQDYKYNRNRIAILGVRVDAFVIYNILEGEVRTEKTSLLLLLLLV